MAAKYVTFGGYRKDIAKIHQSCFVGVIASTGWDSFTMSSIEMAASGLPLLVSDLQGLRETVIDGKTGFLFTPGDSSRLAQLLLKITQGPALRDRLGAESRKYVLQKFTKNRQIGELVKVFKTRSYGSSSF